MIARPKHQRLVLVALAVAAILGAVLLAMWGLRDRAAYFYTPADIAAGQAEQGKAMRLGGMVERGSVQKGEDGITTHFVVEDGGARVPVLFRGILPDLFREGSGVVAEGTLSAGGTFIADNILAKHDERYMPPQLGDEAGEQRAAKTLER
ncbi:MAG: cytochrome c maturation protein CcmE [Pseudomonadota bacterium]|nr:cytochrome c maturation protein CcmE [Pseudomonadota bacterium]